MKIEISDCKNHTESSPFSWKPVCASPESKEKVLKSDGAYRI